MMEGEKLGESAVGDGPPVTMLVPEESESGSVPPTVSALQMFRQPSMAPVAGSMNTVRECQIVIVG